MKLRKMVRKPTGVGFDLSQKWVDIAVLAIIVLFLLSFYKPELLLLDTATSGGDTGSDNYLAQYMKDVLLPQGKISGWAQGRWGGFPMFVFQFPLPYMVMALLAVVMPLTIAFKLVTASGVFLLPFAAYAFFRLVGFKFPAPAIAAIFSVSFLFIEKHTVFGGNIPSILAGEFTYSIALSLVLLFSGLLYRSVERKRFSIVAPLVYVGVILSHVVAMGVGAMLALFFLFKRDPKEIGNNFLLLAVTFGLAFLMTAFWLAPLLNNIEYTTKYGRDWALDFQSWIPNEAVVFFFLAVYGLYVGVRNSDSRVQYLVFGFLVSVIGFFNGEFFKTANIRFWPFIYLFFLLLAAYGTSRLVKRLVESSGNRLLGLKPVMIDSWKKFVLPVGVGLVLVMMLMYTSQNVSFIQGWIDWNYNGFESKDLWWVHSNISETLRGTPGRGWNDLADVNDRLGTPRVFESMPYFSGKNTLEGVYAQATITSPFISYTQCEISHHCAGIPTIADREHTTSYNFENAQPHLDWLNVKHIVATYDDLKRDLADRDDWTLLGKWESWEVWESDLVGDYVVVPGNEPNLMVLPGIKWKEMSLDWWMQQSTLDIPIVFVKDTTGVDSRLLDREVDVLDSLIREPIGDCNVQGEIGNDEISFTTNCVGKPHIIKVSYFPNWQVDGAERVYLVSPSFMLVYPEQENVRLYYGVTGADIVGSLLSIIGVGLLVVIIFHRIRRRYPNQKSSGLNLWK